MMLGMTQKVVIMQGMFHNLQVDVIWWLFSYFTALVLLLLNA